VRLTNVNDLPDAIVRAIENDDYTKGDAEISVTGLDSPARLVALRREHEAEIVEDASDRIWSLLGKAVHGILERAETMGIAEQRLFTEVLGWRLSGAMDRLAMVSEPEDDGWWGIDDYKVTSVWSLKDGGKREWISQLNSYAELCRRHGYRIRRLRIIALLRDWSKNEALRYGSSGYPQQQVAVVEIPLWTPAEVQQHWEARIDAHQQAMFVLPHCTPEERWQRDPAWALTVAGRKTAVRVFGDPEAADAALEAARAKPAKGKKADDYSVQYRPGTAIRCQSYCPVLTQCRALNDGQFRRAICPTTSRQRTIRSPGEVNMAFEHNPGYGSLFVNDQKRSPKAPDLKGNGCCPHCKEQFDIAGWDKQSDSGKQMVQLKIEEPYQGGGGGRGREERRDDRRGGGGFRRDDRRSAPPSRQREPGDDDPWN